MLYIETLSSDKIDLFLERFYPFKSLQFKRRDVLGRVNLFITIFWILYRKKVGIIFISEERVEFRLLSRIFPNVEFRVIHLGLLFVQKPSFSQKLYRTLYSSMFSLFFRGINGLNTFSRHYVFYEENISTLKKNNPKCVVELITLDKNVGNCNHIDSKCILLIPSAWGHHGHVIEEKEQWENFRTIADHFVVRGYKIFLKPHPRGNNDLLFEFGKCGTWDLTIIKTVRDYPGSIVIGNISTLLVDLHSEGYEVYKSLTSSMLTFRNSAIDKIKSIDLLIKT